MSEQKSVADSSAEDSEEDEEVIFNGRDWDEKADRIGSSDWFTPKTGTQKIRFLDEGDDQEREYEDDGETDVREVCVFRIKCGGDEMKWSVTKGTTDSSLWGQLVKVAQDRGGLEGETVTLIRNGTGSDTQYTVQEAANLQ